MKFIGGGGLLAGVVGRGALVSGVVVGLEVEFIDVGTGVLFSLVMRDRYFLFIRVLF